jgi:glycosyltransferase involved in cell wall biosynthesis
MQQNNNSHKKIKVLVLTPTLECGGSEKYVSLLCNSINSQHFDVTLAVISNANPFYAINNSAVKVIDLQQKHVRSSLFKILRIIKTEQPDIIYSTANHLNIYIALFRRLFSKKIIAIARESSVVSVNTKRAKFPVLYNWLIKKCYKNFNTIICQSLYMQQDLIDNYHIKKNKTVVINNPVEDVAAMVQAPAVNKLLTVARLSEEKGIDRLIRSVAKLTIPFQFYIVGDGNRRGILQQLIDELNMQDKIFLMGKKQQPFTGMEDAALFLMGSHYEGFPNVLLEAGALGIPVVAFDVPGGINEIIINGENGILVKNNDETALAKAVEKALLANFSRQQIQAITKTNFSVNAIIKNTEALFIELYTQPK